MVPSASELTFRHGKFPEYRGIRRHLGPDAAHTLDAMELALRHHASERDGILRDYAASIGVEAQDIRSFIGSLTIALEGTSKVQGAIDLRKDLKERDIEALIGWRSTDPVTLSAPHHDPAAEASGTGQETETGAGKAGGAKARKKPEQRSESLEENWLPAAIGGRRGRLTSEDRSPAAIEKITRAYAAAYRTSPTAMRNLNVPLKGHCRLLAAGSAIVRHPAYVKSHAAALVAGRWPSSDIPGAVAAAERFVEDGLEWSAGQAMLKAAWKLGEIALGKTYERSPDDHPEFDILDRDPEEAAARAIAESAPAAQDLFSRLETAKPTGAAKGEAPGEAQAPPPAPPAGDAGREDAGEGGDGAGEPHDEFAAMALETASRLSGAPARFECIDPSAVMEAILATAGKDAYRIVLIRPGHGPEEYRALRDAAVREAAVGSYEARTTLIAIAPEGDAGAMLAKTREKGIYDVRVAEMLPHQTYRPRMVEA